MLEFQYTGYWWLPGQSSDDALPGILKYSSEDRAELRVLGSFSEEADVGEEVSEILLGISDSGKIITLYQCLFVGRTINSPGILETRFRVAYVLVGQHFTIASGIQFSRIAVTYEHLNAWAQLSGMEVSFEAVRDEPSFRKITATYQHPPEVRLNTGDADIRLFTTMSQQWNYVTHFEWNEVVWAEFSWAKPKPLDEIVNSVIYTFRDLVSFGVGSATHVYAMYASVSDPNHPNRSIELYIYWSPGIPHRELQVVEKWAMLFTRTSLADDLATSVKNWFRVSESLAPFYNLYFSMIYSSDLILENQLLNYTQALETYHRRTFEEEAYLSKLQFRALLRSLRGFLHSKHKHISLEARTIFSDSFSFMNEYKQRTRLEQILDRLGEPVKMLIENNATFAEYVVATRNYYTHYSQNKKRKATDVDTLYRLVQQLRFVTELCLLSEMGLSADRIRGIAESSRRYQQLQRLLSSKRAP